MENSQDKKEENIFHKFDNFGKFHAYQYALICAPLLFVSMMNVNYVFVAANVDYRCIVPECENSTISLKKPLWWPNHIDHKCSRPTVVEDSLLSGVCTNSTVFGEAINCHKWVYEDNNSIVSEMNLACESWKATLVGTMHNAGMIISMLMMGWVSDRFGRKPAVILCSVSGIIGMFKSFLNSYYMFLAIEFIESVLSSGLYTVAIVLMIEAGGQTKRVLAGVIFSYAVYVGEVIFAIAAMLVPYWRHLVLIVYSPTVIFILYIFVLQESVRWQMVKGKIVEAKTNLIRIAKLNVIPISAEEINKTGEDELRRKLKVEEKKDKVKFSEIIASTELLRRLAVTSFCFFAAGFVYYGLTIHSVLLPGNKHTNFILASVTSFPGDLLAFFTFNRYGRKISLMCGFVSCSLFCAATAYTPDTIPWLKILVFLCGKLSVALCFTGMFTYSLELFPTAARGALVGAGNVGARIGTAFAPLTPLLVSTMPALPSILFSGSSIIAAVLLTFTPETKDLPLVDTIEQMEKIKKHGVNAL